MFKKIHTYWLLTIVWLFTPGLAFAENAFLEGLKKTAEQGGLKPAGREPTISGPAEFAGVLIGYLLSFVGAIFFVLMLYGGILWMTSRGNEEQVKKAVGVLRSSMLGIIIIFVSYIVTKFILQRLTAGL